MFEYLVLNEYQSFSWNREIRIEVDGDCVKFRRKGNEYGFPRNTVLEGVCPGNPASLLKTLENFNVSQWSEKYTEPVIDGYGWNLRYKEVGKPCRKISGANGGPENYYEFVKLLCSISESEKRTDTIARMTK